MDEGNASSVWKAKAACKKRKFIPSSHHQADVSHFQENGKKASAYLIMLGKTNGVAMSILPALSLSLSFFAEHNMKYCLGQFVSNVQAVSCPL